MATFDLEQASAVLRGTEEAEPGANQTETMAEEVEDQSDEYLPDSKSSWLRLMIIFGFAFWVLLSIVIFVLDAI